MINGVVMQTEEGISPRWQSISPLLSNIMLNELDKELDEKRT